MLRNVGRRVPLARGPLPLEPVFDPRRGAVVPHLRAHPTHDRSTLVDAGHLEVERRPRHLRHPVCSRVLHDPERVQFARFPGGVQFVEVEPVPYPRGATADLGCVEGQLRLDFDTVVVSADVQRPVEIVLVGHRPTVPTVGRAEVDQRQPRLCSMRYGKRRARVRYPSRIRPEVERPNTVCNAVVGELLVGEVSQYQPLPAAIPIHMNAKFRRDTPDTALAVWRGNSGNVIVVHDGDPGGCREPRCESIGHRPKAEFHHLAAVFDCVVDRRNRE